MPFAKVNGVNLFYDIYGSGEPVVFIHGIAITSKVWNFQKADVSKKYKMIAYDLRGSGRSAKTRHIRHTVNILTQDLEELLDYLQIQEISIVAISFGGAVAMNFAAKYPDRVKCMVLTGAIADLRGILDFINRYFGYLIGKMLVNRFFLFIATKLMLPSISFQRVMYYFRNIIDIDSDEIAKYKELLDRYDITAELEKITCPALILYGEHEKVMHRYGSIINKRIKNSEMKIIPNVGHGWNGENPELFNSMVIEFLQKNNI